MCHHGCSCDFTHVRKKCVIQSSYPSYPSGPCVASQRVSSLKCDIMLTHPSSWDPARVPSSFIVHGALETGNYPGAASPYTPRPYTRTSTVIGGDLQYPKSTRLRALRPARLPLGRTSRHGALGRGSPAPGIARRRDGRTGDLVQPMTRTAARGGGPVWKPATASGVSGGGPKGSLLLYPLPNGA